MADIFQIGSARFEFGSDSVVEFVDGGMSFDFRVQPVDYDATLHLKPFDQEGPVAPAFRSSNFSFYDNHDTPRRSVTLPQDSSATVHDFYLWEEGFEFGTRFFGDVDLRPDRIEMRGVVRHDHEPDEAGLPVHIIRNVSPAEVVLKPHTYGSIGEALAAPHERVRRILIKEWGGQFSADLLRFTNLEFLSLQQVFVRPGQPDSELPEEIGNLAKLRELYIRSHTVGRLPDRLGELAHLEVLGLSYCRIDTLPEGMRRLGNLKRLLLTGNQLGTVPAWVGQLPSLTVLGIEDNPLTSLPGSLTNIDKVLVEKKHEALFRDITYRPELNVTVDRERFLARSSPEHVALLSDALARHGLTRYREALLRHATQAVRLRTTEADDYSTLGNSRIAGAPDLPPDIDYPATDGKLWHFYAQLNLSELAALQSWLPRTGMLYFFSEGQEHGDNSRVLYSDADTLSTYQWPEDPEFTDDDNDLYDGFRVHLDATVSVPNLYNAHRWAGEQDVELLGIEDDESVQDTYWKLEEELTGNADRFRGAHLINSHIFTQHESPQEQASLALGGLPSEWVNLLMVDSDGNPGLNFWDAGTFTFSIHEKDLTVRDFSRVHWSLESS